MRLSAFLLCALSLCLSTGCHRREAYPVPYPVPTPYPVPEPHRHPHWSHEDEPTTGLIEGKVGGRVAPDGRTEIQIDLPGDLQQKNIASRGLGCCVWRSGDHAARWQNVPALQGMPEWMVQRGIEGGGYPSKVDKLVPMIAKDRGYPTPRYLQVEGKDLDILRLACKTGRMPCITYSYSPTGRYGGQKIAHMVNLVHADANYFGILDNNFVGEDAYEWLSPEEFLGSYAAGGAGWAWILLEPPPPPPPHN